jgi:uncharacterized protein (DUF952 family)
MIPIYHITSREQARLATEMGEYKPLRFDQEGFIHCSYAHQIPVVADFNFRGQSDLVLFEIDRSKLSCRVIDENLEGGSELFPHIYGPLPIADAVLRVIDFPCGADGLFAFPDYLAGRISPDELVLVA